MLLRKGVWVLKQRPEYILPLHVPIFGEFREPPSFPESYMMEFIITLLERYDIYLITYEIQLKAFEKLISVVMNSVLKIP